MVHDFNLIYIRKCQKARSLQLQHKPKQGDYYICDCESCIINKNVLMIESYDIDSINKRDLKNVYPPYAKMVKDSDTCSFHAYSSGRQECLMTTKDRLGYVWLPTQNDIQRLLLEDNTWKELLREFWDFISAHDPWEGTSWCDFDNFEQACSLNGVWLEFYMQEKFKKTWNPELNNWEEINEASLF